MGYEIKERKSRKRKAEKAVGSKAVSYVVFGLVIAATSWAIVELGWEQTAATLWLHLLVTFIVAGLILALSRSLVRTPRRTRTFTEWIGNSLILTVAAGFAAVITIQSIIVTGGMESLAENIIIGFESFVSGLIVYVIVRMEEAAQGGGKK